MGAPRKGDMKMKMPEITVNRHWNVADLREACIRNNLYTRGTNEDYDHMFDHVRLFYPDFEALYLVAKDIYDHSVDQTITNIMYIIENEVVRTTFELDGKDYV